MTPRLLDEAKQAIEERARSVGVTVAIDALAALLAAVSFFFFTLAVFVWAAAQFGGVVAGLALGVVYLALAAGVLARARRRTRSLAAPAQRAVGAGHGSEHEDADWLVAPTAIAGAIEILRRIGANRLIPAFALTAVAIAAAQATRQSARGKGEAAEETGRRTGK
jgi:hypothetical protein